MTHSKNGRLRTARKEINSIIRRLSAAYKPQKIILFGSLAKGRISSSSDIDLVVVKNTHKDPWSRLREADRFIDHNFPVDLLVYTPKEIKQRLEMGDTFVEEIVEKGKVVYER